MSSSQIETKWNCPQCGSTNTQRLSILHKQQTSGFSAVSTGAGLGVAGGLDAVGVGISTASGTITSALAKEAAAPTAEPTNVPAMSPWALIGGFLGLVAQGYRSGVEIVETGDFLLWHVLLILLWCFLGTFLGGIVGWIVNPAKRRQEQAAATARNDEARARNALKQKKWEQGFMCLRCGHRYEIDPAANSPSHESELPTQALLGVCRAARGQGR